MSNKALPATPKENAERAGRGGDRDHVSDDPCVGELEVGGVVKVDVAVADGVQEEQSAFRLRGVRHDTGAVVHGLLVAG